MITSAVLKNARISPQKARLIANMVSGKQVANAVDILRFSNKKSSKLIAKVLNSAVSNAENNFAADIDELFISSIAIDQGITHKRFHTRARGRSSGIKKRCSHITVEVSDQRGDKHGS